MYIQIFYVSDNRPIVIVTYRDVIAPDRMKKIDDILKVNVSPDRIHWVANFTQDPNADSDAENIEERKKEEQQRRLEFLKLLAKLLQVADNNLIFKTNRGIKGNPEENGQLKSSEGRIKKAQDYMKRKFNKT